jgi:hypothetical protein
MTLARPGGVRGAIYRSKVDNYFETFYIANGIS